MILEPEMLKRFQPLAVVPGGPATANLMFLGLPTSNHRCPKGERSNISLNISICFHYFMIRLLTRTWPRGRIREDTLGVSPLPTPGWSRTFPSAQTWDIQVGQPSPAALRAGDLCPMWPGDPGIVGGGNWGYPVINGIIDSGILRGFILFNGD